MVVSPTVLDVSGLWKPDIWLRQITCPTPVRSLSWIISRVVLRVVLLLIVYVFNCQVDCCILFKNVTRMVSTRYPQTVSVSQIHSTFWSFNKCIARSMHLYLTDFTYRNHYKNRPSSVTQAWPIPYPLQWVRNGSRLGYRGWKSPYSSMCRALLSIH